VWQESIPLKNFGNISPIKENFKNKILHAYVVLLSAELTNFIQLCLTLTKLCHIKHDHLVNFYISLEKHQKCDISATV